jgi:hypothetical protein
MGFLFFASAEDGSAIFWAVVGFKFRGVIWVFFSLRAGSKLRGPDEVELKIRSHSKISSAWGEKWRLRVDERRESKNNRQRRGGRKEKRARRGREEGGGRAIPSKIASSS